MPKAPFLSWRAIRMTVWAKRGSPMEGVAISSWPASEARAGRSFGASSAACASAGTAHARITLRRLSQQAMAQRSRNVPREQRSTKWCAADPGSRAAHVDPGSAVHRSAALRAALHPGNAAKFSEKRQRAYFNALARARAGRRGRVGERRVGGPAGAAVLLGIVDLEHDRLVALLAREPEPAMRRVVFDRVGLADAGGIAPLGNHEVGELHAARVADRERERFDRMPERPPHLHDGEAALEQLLGLVRQEVAHALRAGPFGIVVVRALHRLADLVRLAIGLVGGAQGVVEHHDALRPGLRLYQGFHLRIVDPLDLVRIEE